MPRSKLGRPPDPDRSGALGAYGAWTRHALAVVLTLTTSVAAQELPAAWGTTRHPYLVAWPTVIAAAWLGGLGPGLVATGLSTVLLLFFWLEPVRSFRVSAPGDIVALAAYAVCGIAVSFVIERLHRARAEEHNLRRSREIVLSVVAHDLRSPLNTIRMATSLLRRDPSDASRIDAIDRSTGRMDRLIRDLLDASVLDSRGALSMTLADEDAAALLADAVTASTPAAASRSISIVRDVDRTAPLVVRCDRERLLQVFTNLLGNALKFSPEGSTVAVRASRTGSFIEFSVTDSGPGIDPDHQVRIFDRHWTGRAPGSGAGLGLYIAGGIVRAHGGTLSLRSTLGKGATFTFTIPAGGATLRGPGRSGTDRVLLA